MATATAEPTAKVDGASVTDKVVAAAKTESRERVSGSGETSEARAWDSRAQVD
jgi:hypothetical protein